MIYDVPVAKTAADVYMRRLLGNAHEALPLPTNKVEVFLYLLCGGDYNTPQPITSEERFLAYLLGVSGVTLPTPQTRLETYMDKVCRRGSNAVVSPKTRYELYWWLWAGVTEITSSTLPVIFQASLPYLRNYQIYGNTNTTRPNAIDNTQWVMYSWYNANGIDVHGEYGATTNYMLYGGTVKLNFANPVYSLALVYFDSDKNFISREYFPGSIVREITNTPPSNTAYFKLQVSCAVGDRITVEYIENFGVVLTTELITPDSPATYVFVGDKYEPYNKYKIPITMNGDTTNVYIDEPLRKIDDYADYVDYVRQLHVRNIQKLIFTGNENWEMQEISTLTARFLVNIQYSISQSSGLCSHARFVRTGVSNDEVVCGINNNIFYFQINKEIASNVIEFKDYLSSQAVRGTPVTIYYPCVTPTAEPLTLSQIPTQDGTNTLTVETTVAPSKVVIEA